MSLTVGDFKESLRTLAKRGSALDAHLPGVMRKAANWIEQNYTLQYMRRKITLQVAPGAVEVELPSIRIKSIGRLGWRFGSGDYVRLRQVDFDDFTPAALSLSSWPTSNEAGVPGSYCLDGMSTILLSLPAPTNVVLDGWVVRYSDWPKEDSQSHWLLQNAESLMEVQCMLELAVLNRDDRNYQLFMSHRDEQIKVLQNADYEARYSGQDIVLGQE